MCVLWYVCVYECFCILTRMCVCIQVKHIRGPDSALIEGTA